MLALLSDGFQSLSPSTHNHIGPFLCWFLGGWVCVHSRTLWVSPTNSPVRLGVSPTATSTPTGVFSQSFEALFPCTGTLGCTVYLVPQLFLPVYLYSSVGSPHWVCQPQPFCKSSSPSCLSLPLLPVWMNVFSLAPWFSDFHTV